MNSENRPQLNLVKYFKRYSKKRRDRFIERIGLHRQNELYRRVYEKYENITMVPRKAFVENLRLVQQTMDCDELADGSIVECGTRLGGMFFGIVELCSRSQEFHCFDSFEAMPAAGDRDGVIAQDLQKTGGLLSIDECFDAFMRGLARLDEKTRAKIG